LSYQFSNYGIFTSIQQLDGAIMADAASVRHGVDMTLQGASGMRQGGRRVIVQIAMSRTPRHPVTA